MPLTGTLLERTQQAIVATFSRRDDLRQFVRFQLDESFDALVRDDNLRVQAYELLLWAGRSGRELELIDKFLEERPAEGVFAAVAEALRSGAPLVPPESQHVRLPGGGRVPLQKPLRVQHFIGRELEMARLLAELQPGAVRTLCGPGGMGKTALAAEAIWRLAPGDDPPDRFPDGIIFHTFYHQPQAAQALEKIAISYNIDPRPTARDAAQMALAGRKALIVLDGAEAADDLEAVLSVAGGCGVLITTRQHQQAPADWQDIEPLPREESLQLLRQWAGTYAADDQSANEIVRLLGGLPLALFLVGRYLSQRKQEVGVYGQWLQMQGLGALHFADRPSKSIPLLLRQSLEQVSEGAQRAFGVAGVLALAPIAAEVVAAALEIEPPAAHHLLGELVDYGLLLRPDKEYQVTHALAHTYARTEVKPATELIKRLALHYAILAKRESARGLTGFAVIDRHLAHLIAVQAVALSAGEWKPVQWITSLSIDYLDLCSSADDRIAVVQAGLQAARADMDRYNEGAFLNMLGNAYADLGDTRRAVKLYEQALVIDCEIGDHRGEGIVLNNLGNAYADLGETRRAVELYEQALIIDRETGHRREEGNAVCNLGNACVDLGEIRRAIEYYEQYLEIVRELGDRRGEGNVLGNLGNTYALLGETHRAVQLYELQLVITREIGDRHGESNSLGNLGVAYAAMGNIHRAVKLYEQSLMIDRDIGDRRGEGAALGNLGNAYVALGETHRAIELYEQYLAIARETGDRSREGIASWNLGLVYEEDGDLARAAELMQVRVAYEHEIGHPDAAAHAEQVTAIKARAGL